MSDLIGRKVRVTGNNSSHGFELGTVVTLQAVFNYGQQRQHWRAESDSGAHWYLNAQEFELIEEAPVEPARRQAKVGDKVRITEDTHSHGYEIGSIVTIREIVDGGTGGEYWRATNADGRNRSLTPEEGELIDEEEAQPKPAPRQAKVGDKVRILKSQWFNEAGDILEVVEDDANDQYYVIKGFAEVSRVNDFPNVFELVEEAPAPALMIIVGATYKVARKDSWLRHCAELGSLVECLEPANGGYNPRFKVFGNYEDGYCRQYIDPADLEFVSGPVVKDVEDVEATPRAPRTEAPLYVVVHESRPQDFLKITSDRDEARSFKAGKGGKRAGYIINQYSVEKEIR